MIIDLRTLKRYGQDRKDFFFEYSGENSEIEIPYGQIVYPIKINGSVELTGNHSAYVSGEISVTLKGECTRCLKETQKDFVFDFAEQLEENAEQGYSVEKDRIDLTKIVLDAIVMELPLNFLCKEDCKGICLKCGVNLNDQDCKCEK